MDGPRLLGIVSCQHAACQRMRRLDNLLSGNGLSDYRQSGCVQRANRIRASRVGEPTKYHSLRIPSIILAARRTEPRSRLSYAARYTALDWGMRQGEMPRVDSRTLISPVA